MKKLFGRLKRMEGLKLNIKFTFVTICFVVFPVAILGIVLFRNMENNVVSEKYGPHAVYDGTEQR